MIITSTIEQFNSDYIYAYNPVKNNIMENSKFVRIIYSNSLFVLNGIYISFDFDDNNSVTVENNIVNYSYPNQANHTNQSNHNNYNYNYNNKKFNNHITNINHTNNVNNSNNSNNSNNNNNGVNITNTNKTKYFFNVNTNRSLIDKLISIEQHIMNKSKMSKEKLPKYYIAEQLQTGSIKIYNSKPDKPNNNSFILKISGFWETDNRYGLTYKFISSENIAV